VLIGISLSNSSTYKKRPLFKPATPEQLRVRAQETGYVTSNVLNEAVAYAPYIPLFVPGEGANFTLAAAIDLERAHGLNLEEELVRYLGNEARRAIDGQVQRVLQGEIE
jgi:hypothetical protein